MNETEIQFKLANIFHHFEILMKYTKNNCSSLYMSDNFKKFFAKYNEYSNLIKSGKDHNLDTLLELYKNFEIYSPSVGKSKLILKSIDRIFKSIQFQPTYEEEFPNAIDENIKPLLNLIKKDFKDKIQIIKKEIIEHQIEIARLKLQDQTINQQYVSKILNISDFIVNINELCKSMSPDILKKADDHQIKMISDLIYVIDKME